MWSFPSTTISGNWPHWRGPENNGVSEGKDLPAEWTTTANVRWRLQLPGPAPSTPVVWNDRIFLTTAEDSDLCLMAVSTAGSILWKREIASGNSSIRQGESNAASPSPSTDGSHVWAFFGTGELVCYTIDGDEVWKTNLASRYGDFDMYWGMSSSPLLDGERLYVTLIHSKSQLVLALDKMTGKEIWKHTRKTDAKTESLHSYASPVIYRDESQSFLISHGADYVIAHDLKGGAEIWRCGGMQETDYNHYLRFVATPAVVPGLIVIPSAKSGPILGLNPVGAKGDITAVSSQYHWKRKDSTTDVPSPLIHGGLVYICRENGVLLCLDAKTGGEVYKASVYRKQHRSSPVYADGKIFLTASDGTVSVIEAGRTYKLLAQNSLDEYTAASPVIVDDTIYIRTYDALYAIGKLK